MLVLPRITTPASLQPRASPSRRTADASPRGSASRRSSARPRVVSTSLSASGTPASGPTARRRPRVAVDGGGRGERALGVDVQERVHAPSTAAIRSRWACATSTARHLAGGDGDRGGSAAVSRVRSVAVHGSAPRPGSAGPGTAAPRRPGRRTAPRSRRRPGRTTSARKTLVSGTACDVGGTSSRRHLGDLRDRVEDHVELPGEVVELVVGRGSSRASRARCATSSRVIDGASDGRHPRMRGRSSVRGRAAAHPRRPSCCPRRGRSTASATCRRRSSHDARAQPRGRRRRPASAGDVPALRGVAAEAPRSCSHACSVSTPSATACRPSAWASSMIERTIDGVLVGVAEPADERAVDLDLGDRAAA